MAGLKESIGQKSTIDIESFRYGRCELFTAVSHIAPIVSATKTRPKPRSHTNSSVVPRHSTRQHQPRSVPAEAPLFSVTSLPSSALRLASTWWVTGIS